MRDDSDIMMETKHRDYNDGRSQVIVAIEL